MNLETGPWIGKDHWVSHLNFLPEVRSGLRIPPNVIFYDVTLRDGEQTPGVVFRREEKVAIARLLDEVGVQRIEAGMPVVSEEDAAAVREIARLGLRAQVMGFCRLVKEDVDASRRCDVSGVICEGPVGHAKLKQMGWPSEQTEQRALEIIEYAKGYGLDVRFFGVDGTRADLVWYLRLLQRLERETRVDGFVLVDTFGCATPEAMRYFVRQVRAAVGRPLEIHCHNDLGFGVANTIAGVLAGADVVHTSVNGIGERSGNAAFEEVALALKLLYGVPLPFRFERFYELARRVEASAGFPLQPNKPVVGERVFHRESGISVAGWVKMHLGSEPYLPHLVGNRHGVVIGKKSGRHSVEWKLRELGLTATEEQLALLLDRVKTLAEERKREVSDAEFRALYAQLVAAPAR